MPFAQAHALLRHVSERGQKLVLASSASGNPGRSPCVLLLHGLPGDEQNVDCAQSMRRAGCNVLTIHYYVLWGRPGSFSFGHCLDEAAAALEWLQRKGRSGACRIDPDRIVLVGHSMGGSVAAHVAVSHPDVLGVALLSGADLGEAFGRGDRSDVGAIASNVGVTAGLAGAGTGTRTADHARGEDREKRRTILRFSSLSRYGQSSESARTRAALAGVLCKGERCRGLGGGDGDCRNVRLRH